MTYATNKKVYLTDRTGPLGQVKAAIPLIQAWVWQRKMASSAGTEPGEFCICKPWDKSTASS
jgi:hypothetical protein